MKAHKHPKLHALSGILNQAGERPRESVRSAKKNACFEFILVNSSVAFAAATVTLSLAGAALPPAAVIICQSSEMPARIWGQFYLQNSNLKFVEFRVVVENSKLKFGGAPLSDCGMVICQSS